MVKILLNLRPLTIDIIKDKNFILEMLKFEDEYYFSNEGQSIMADIGKNNIFSLDAVKTIQRITLNHFGFSSTDEDIALYRTIFQHYYTSPLQYDKDILSSVYYMRENRLLYYTSPQLGIGDNAVDTPLVELDGITETTLFNIMNEQPMRKTVVCAFSLS